MAALYLSPPLSPGTPHEMLRLFCHLVPSPSFPNPLFSCIRPPGLDSLLETLYCFLVGLEAGVGKTTVLYWLKAGTALNTVQTVGFNMETIERNNTSYEMWDIGGGDKIRDLWPQYFGHAKAVIFVLDSTYKDGMDTNKFVLTRLLKDEQLEHCPFLILANKQDSANAMAVEDIKKALKLDQWKNRQIHILPSNAKEGTGVTEGFDWLCSELEKLVK